MKAAAGIATLVAHAVAFLGLGSLDVHQDPAPDPPLEVTTIELVELPAPAPVVEAVPDPVLEPEAAPEPEPAADPEPPAPPPRPRPRADPSPPSPTPQPATATPSPAGPPAASPTPAPTTPASTPTAPRKLEQRFSNAKPPKGRQRGAAKRCTEPIVKPVPTRSVKAKFPAAALRSDISGDLILRANVDRTGAVSSVEVVKSPGALVEPAAEAAFAQWRFTPATACGKPVASTYKKRWKFIGG